MHAHAHPVYMARKNLSEIAHYAELALSFLEATGEALPQWVFFKISAVRTHMKDVGHFIRYESHQDRAHRKGENSEERRYSGKSDADFAHKMLRQIIEYAEATDGILATIDHRIPQWVDHKLSICSEYMDCVGHFLEDEAAHGRRYAGPAWNTEAGQLGIERGHRLQQSMHRGESQERRYAAATTRRPERPPEPGRETRPLPAKIGEAGESPSGKVGKTVRHVAGGRIAIIDDGNAPYGAAVGGGNMNKSRPPEDFMPSLRMKVPNRMGRQNRMLHRQPPEAAQPEGTKRRYEPEDFEPQRRRYGVPGFSYGEPGWAGAGGVAQRPLGAVRGPRAAQTYGSLGYASMGDGSMDMAVRGGRRMAGRNETGQWGGIVINATQPAAYASGLRGRRFRKMLKKGG